MQVQTSCYCVLCAYCCHAHLFVIPWTAVCQLPLSMGIFQTRILQWVAISFSQGSSLPRAQTWVSCIAGRFFTNRTTREAFSPSWAEQKVPKMDSQGPPAWASGLISGLSQSPATSIHLHTDPHSAAQTPEWACPQTPSNLARGPSSSAFPKQLCFPLRPTRLSRPPSPVARR